MKESSGSFFHTVYERNSVLTLEPTTAWNEKMKALTFETLQNDFKNTHPYFLWYWVWKRRVYTYKCSKNNQRHALDHPKTCQ